MLKVVGCWTHVVDGRSSERITTLPCIPPAPASLISLTHGDQHLQSCMTGQIQATRALVDRLLDSHLPSSSSARGALNGLHRRLKAGPGHSSPNDSARASRAVCGSDIA